MQLASSLRYGGLLVKAVDCDHEAYRNLGLVCPNCHESVFMVQEHIRYFEETDKTVKVIQHFSHRKDKSAQAMPAAVCSRAMLRKREATFAVTVLDV